MKINLLYSPHEYLKANEYVTTFLFSSIIVFIEVMTPFSKNISEAPDGTWLQAPRDEEHQSLGPFKSILVGCVTLGLCIAEVCGA